VQVPPSCRGPGTAVRDRRPSERREPGVRLPGWSHELNLADFVINQGTAIGRYHRDVLHDGGNWADILREISLLIGLGEVSATAGPAADMWAVAITGEGSAQLQLAAWHQPSAADATVEELRLGYGWPLPGGATVALVSEVLTFGPPASGTANVAFLGAHDPPASPMRTDSSRYLSSRKIFQSTNTGSDNYMLGRRSQIPVTEKWRIERPRPFSMIWI
jgi:hypothetical protein